MARNAIWTAKIYSERTVRSLDIYLSQKFMTKMKKNIHAPTRFLKKFDVSWAVRQNNNFLRVF